eukprot:1173742-Rhodomonas_salina.3
MASSDCKTQRHTDNALPCLATHHDAPDQEVEIRPVAPHLVPATAMVIVRGITTTTAVFMAIRGRALRVISAKDSFLPALGA